MIRECSESAEGISRVIEGRFHMRKGRLARGKEFSCGECETRYEHRPRRVPMDPNDGP